MEPKNRVEVLRIERGNLTELTKEERIERAFESMKRYYEALLHPLTSSAEVKDYTEAMNETLESLEPDELEVISARLQPVIQEWSSELVKAREAKAWREIYLDEMSNVSARGIIDNFGGLEQLERTVGSEEAERLRKKAEKEE